jgi:hypothetical protein
MQLDSNAMSYPPSRLSTSTELQEVPGRGPNWVPGGAPYWAPGGGLYGYEPGGGPYCGVPPGPDP